MDERRVVDWDTNLELGHFLGENLAKPLYFRGKRWKPPSA